MGQRTVLSLIEFSDAQLDKLRAVSPHLDVRQKTAAHVDDLAPELRDRVEVLYGWGKPLHDAHRFPRLKWVQTHSAGINDLLDKPVWRSPVILTTANGIHPIPMAEHALAMMLAFRWKLRTMFQMQARRTWPRDRWDTFIMPELRGSTLGIVGYGAIGRELARLARAMGMRVLALNRSGQRRRYQGFGVPGTGDPDAAVPEEIYPTGALFDMLPECDYVVVSAPQTPDTYHLIGPPAFSHMKPSTFFFNLARGAVVDEAALIEALRQGQIAGAGLDVFEEEPLPENSPLWAMENVIISPHISGFTPQYDERAGDLFVENLRRYLNDEPLLNLVDREHGY